MTILLHATSRNWLESIRLGGLHSGSYWTNNPEIARYYAKCVADEGEPPVILLLRLDELDEIALRPDHPSIQEPITTVLGKTEDQLHEAWRGSDWTWRACLDVVGSVYYTKPIPFDVFRIDTRLDSPLATIMESADYDEATGIAFD